MFIHSRVIGYYSLLLLALTDAEIAVRVAVNGSFNLVLSPNALDNEINCTLIRSGKIIAVIPLTMMPETTEDQRIVSLGNNLCGAKIHNAVFADAGLWNLTVSNSTEAVSKIFRVNTIFWEEPVNRTSTAVVGDLSKTILCGPSSMLYCDLKDPLGNVVALSSNQRCETTIQVVGPTDFGIWNCTVGVAGSMAEIHATHTLAIGDPVEKVLIFANETSFGTLLNWQVERIVAIASWCRAFPPNGKTIMVASGLEVENYVSVGTDLSERKCGLLVKGEFLEEYRGLWRLEIGINNIRTIGGFIEMPEGKIPGPNDPSASVQNPISSQATDIRVAVGQSFRIKCQVQYSAGYCWIKGPQGEIETPSEELNVGRCSLTVNNASSENHTGNWTCNMAHVNGGHEDHFDIKVTVIDKLYEALNPMTIVFPGEKTVFGCRSVLNSPLQYCRFLRPDGVGLGITPGMNESERYSYDGPGLDYGHCGLAISSTQAVDFGEWTCVSRSRFHTWGDENFDTFRLEAYQTSSASVIGMAMGLVLLAVVIAGTLIVVYRRRRNQEVEAHIMVEYTNE